MFRLTTKVFRMTSPTAISVEVGSVLKDLMAQRKLSQRALSDSTAIPLTTLTHRLSGKRAFTLPELAAVASVLDISLTDLFLRVERISVSNAA